MFGWATSVLVSNLVAQKKDEQEWGSFSNMWLCDTPYCDTAGAATVNNASMAAFAIGTLVGLLYIVYVAWALRKRLLPSRAICCSFDTCYYLCVASSAIIKCWQVLEMSPDIDKTLSVTSLDGVKLRTVGVVATESSLQVLTV